MLTQAFFKALFSSLRIVFLNLKYVFIIRKNIEGVSQFMQQNRTPWQLHFIITLKALVTG